MERHPDAATVDLAQHPESPATVIPVVTETPCGQFWVEMQDGHPVLFDGVPERDGPRAVSC